MYRCASPWCPGYPWRASETPHPVSCSLNPANAKGSAANLEPTSEVCSSKERQPLIHWPRLVTEAEADRRASLERIEGYLEITNGAIEAIEGHLAGEVDLHETLEDLRLLQEQANEALRVTKLMAGVDDAV